MIEDGREKQALAERKTRERKERKERQGELEKKWEMLRWLTKFIDENRDSWDDISREERKMKDVVANWAEKTREEKIGIITSEEKLSEEEIWHKYRCCADELETEKVSTIIFSVQTHPGSHPATHRCCTSLPHALYCIRRRKFFHKT